MMRFVRYVLCLGALVCATAVTAQPFLRMVKPTATEEVLQTKARKYVPKIGIGPTVWLVGVAHVGQADYFKSIQKLLDDQGTVLYEGVTRKGVDRTVGRAEPKDDPRQRSTYQMLSDSLHLQFQLYGIDYKRQNFRNSDLSWEEMSAIESKYPAAAKGGISLTTIGSMLDANSSQGKAIAAAMSAIKDDPSSVEAMHLIMIETISDPNALSQTLSPQLNDLLIRSRNAKVLSDLKAELAKNPGTKSVAVFFGAGHMSDMEKHLVSDLGYQPGEERWFTAISGDTKKVTGNGLMMLQLMRAQLQKRTQGH